MAKKKSSDFILVNLLAISIGVIAIIIFGVFPMVKSTINLTDAYTLESSLKGFAMIFGGTAIADQTQTITALGATNVTTATIDAEVKFNTMAFVSFATVALGLVLTIATTFVKSLSKNKMGAVISGLLIIVGGILMFTIKNSTIEALDATNFADGFKLAYGAIVSGILSIIAGMIVLMRSIARK